MVENYDFSGWATRNDLKCADGRTIRKGAFKHNDGERVPLVWNHDHVGIESVIGHALLENREEGVYMYGFLNDTELGEIAKKQVKHGDLTHLSIYANQLREKAGEVFHGVIREVSLVMAGANPGAYIDYVVAHSDDGDAEGIMYLSDDCALELYHAEEKKDEPKDEPKEAESAGEKSAKEIFDSLTEEQQSVVYAVIDQVANGKGGSEDEEDSKGGEEDMKHNVFENDQQDTVLQHDAMEAIIRDGKRYGSLKESFLQHKQEYGIENIDWLFPEAKTLTNEPGFIKRQPDEWVSIVLNGVHHTPFSRIKSVFADLREDDARAKGYAKKAQLKKEEVFGLMKRETTPTTIYKKQKLDRDDIIDITDFNVVSWLKGEMRMMLDEEIARAILFGDGRTAMDPDKIPEANIRPVVSDTALFTIAKEVKPEAGQKLGDALIDAAVEAQDEYEGSGNLILFTANTTITQCLLLKDGIGHRLYKTVAELALACNVSRIVAVPAAVIPSGIYGVMLNLGDYNVGADKGGSINMFEDFDIDYNQEKYLMETRCSGALTKPFSAIVLKEAANAAG